MYKVRVNRNLLIERQKYEETNRLVEGFVRELSEALAPADVDKIVGKYMGKLKDPTSQNNFLKQAASFLGRKANVSPDEFELALRQNYATNFDPAKLQRGQTPAQKAGNQAAKKAAQEPLGGGKTQPPPLSTMQKVGQAIRHPASWMKTQAWNKQQQKDVPSSSPKPLNVGKPPAGGPRVPHSYMGTSTPAGDWKPQPLSSPSIPSLSTLAKQAGEPEKKGAPKVDKPKVSGGLPDLPDLEPQEPEEEPKQSPTKEPEEPKKAKEKDDEAPADQEVDMDDFGEKEPAAGKEKPAKSEPSKSKKPRAGKTKKKAPDYEVDSDEEEGEESSGSEEPKGVSTPTLSSLVKRQQGSDAALAEPKNLKVGQKVNVGSVKGLKVTKKAGDVYSLEKGNRKYLYNPTKGYWKRLE